MRLRGGVWSIVQLLIGVLAILVYLGVEAVRRRGNERPFRYERVGAPRLPELNLLGPDGSMRAVSSHGRRAMLLHSWATWCPPCREELPGLLELQKEMGGGGLEVVAVIPG